jgi:ADP-heptose:LPS heptosyltransferase
VDQYVDVARVAGADADAADFGLEPTAEATSSVQAKLASSQPYVVCNAGAGWASKRWPPAHFGRLAEGLETRGLRPVFIGAKADSNVFDEVRATTSAGTTSLVGQTSIAELIALIAGAKAHVGGDTGSSHIAAALGVPAVGLYSTTSPSRTCPYGQIDRCLYDSDGLDRIPPERVLDEVLGAI